MISFRFHVVSITAIFLAIAIGVVVGSTYVDGAVVDGLRSRIRTVEGNVSDARDENGRLEDQLQSTREYVDLSSEYAVTDRLTDVPVFLTAARGVDEATVERTLVLARQAGGIVPGIVWLEQRWAADGDEDLEDLALIVGGSATDARDVLWASAWEDITDELVAGAGAQDPDGGDASILAQLEEAGFLTVDPLDDETVGLDDLIGAAPRVAIVTGARAEEEVAPVVPVAVTASVDAGLVTVVGDVYVAAPEAPGRGATLTESFDDAVREATVIVDDVDLEAGRVAVVLGMDAAAEGETGRHYGYGDGADAVLPAWTPP
ncbi:MAG: copper transporter [Acidimicrobiales bacterium]